MLIAFEVKVPVPLIFSSSVVYVLPSIVLDIPTSIAIFEEILEADPYRTDGVDTYSNILYTEQKQAKLSQLAQHFMGVNKDRPEVSMVIGSCIYSCQALSGELRISFVYRELLQSSK